MRDIAFSLTYKFLIVIQTNVKLYIVLSRTVNGLMGNNAGECKLENYATLIENIGLKAFSANLCSVVSSRNSVGQRVSCYAFWSLSASINI